MTHIYCDSCGKRQPLKIDPMTDHDGVIWGDLLCSVCGLVIATIDVDEEGEYEFVKVR